MVGTVDGDGRALLPVRLQHPDNSGQMALDAWIDTGFTGDLVLPQRHIDLLALRAGLSVRAGLADGTEVKLETYPCLLEWFGQWMQIEVVANRGQFPLLGVGLLLGRKLQVDYVAMTMEVV